MELSEYGERKLSTLPYINPKRPPLDWVKHTLCKKNGPVHISIILQEVVKNLGIEKAYDNFEPDENIRTAKRIIDDAPMFLCGKVTLNRYGHGAWAYLTLGDIEKAESVLTPAIKNQLGCKLSEATFFCAVLLKIKQNKTDEAMQIILNAGRWYDVIHNPTFKSLQSLATQLH